MAAPCCRGRAEDKVASNPEVAGAAILADTRVHSRDHVIIALALDAGLRLGEIVGLNVGDVYPRNRLPAPGAGQ